MASNPVNKYEVRHLQKLTGAEPNLKFEVHGCGPDCDPGMPDDQASWLRPIGILLPFIFNKLIPLLTDFPEL